MSKTIKVVIIILVLVLLAGAGYWLWTLKEDKAESDDQQKTEQDVSLEAQQTPGVTYLTNSSVISPVLAYDNLSIWYFDKDNGQLLRQHLQYPTDIQIFPLPEHENINFALWPDSGSDIILASSNEKMLFTSAANQFIPYPAAVKYITWMPGGQKVAYIWSDERETVLSTALSSLIDHRTIATLPSSDFRAEASANGKSFALYQPGRGAIYFVIDDLGALETIRQGEPISNLKFSPDGKNLAYIVEKNGVKYLHTFNISDRAEKVLGEIDGDFIWSQDGAYLYWYDGLLAIKRFESNPGTTSSVLDFTSSDDFKGATQLLYGRSPKELFFIETQTGRLGKIILK